ncbi:MAG: Type I transmembrane sorting receptor [Trichoglossum hirsutum]|nr:MAG: Type I transmembrane sorting receptor [Trichoglossum hirsutum]
MVFLGHLSLATVALSSFAISSPVGLEKRRTFSVQQQANPNFSGRNGNLAMAKAYRKYGATMPEAEVITAVTSYNGDGEVVATPAQFDSEYISPVSLGGQTLNLVFDTGSADLWVFSTFQSPNSTAGHHVYDNTKSSTFKALNGSVWSIHYGDGSGASGIVGTETVKVGGVTVTKQAVELATSVSASFVRDTNTDGLLGLSFGTINRVKPVQQKTFFDNAKPRLTAPVFTADLKHDAPGTYDFGFIDPAKFEGPIAYLPVNSSRGFWGFTALGHGVGGNSFNSMPVTGIAGKLTLPSDLALWLSKDSTY